MPYLDEVWDSVKWPLALLIVLCLGFAIGKRDAVGECEGAETVEAK